ncbi:hypothetical protein BDQ17DRAFT_1354744 [Cyathus striatus]|nr:hypothetical protein BDQ17DRAFT_1354744 [Cyathus striatus]
MSALANAQLHYVIPGSFKKKKQNVYWAHLDGPKPSSRDLVRGAEALNLPSPSSWDTGLATLVDSTSHAPIYEIRCPPPTARAASGRNLEDQLQAKTNEQSSIHSEVENLKADMKDTLEMVKVQKETLEVILNFLQQDMEKKFIFPNFRRSKIFCLLIIPNLFTVEHVLQYQNEIGVKGNLCKKIVAHLDEDFEILANDVFKIHGPMKEIRNSIQHPTVSKNRALACTNELEWGSDSKASRKKYYQSETATR